MIAHLSGVGLWLPGFASVDAWRAGTADPEVTAPTGELLGRRAARRATPIALMVADALGEACAQAGVPAGDAGLVLATVGGELATTFECLELGLEDPPASSPLRFRNSVHNAALGHVGIALGATGYASAIAGAPEQLAAMAWLEALAWVAAEGTPCAAVLVDEAWPGADHGPGAVAFLFTPDGPGLGAVTAIAPGAVPTPALEDALATSPIRTGLAALAALTVGGPLPLGEGDAAWHATWTPS